MPTQVIDTGAHNKLVKLFEALEQRIPEEALRPMAMEVAMQIAERAPSPDQEYATMQTGEIVSGGTRKPTPGEESRIRFIKPRENYLRNYLPASFRVMGLYVGIGDVDELNLISQYSYVNATKSKTYEHLVTAPMWWAWEHGGVFTITPKFQTPRPYKLAPTPEVWASSMVKTIPAHAMFASVDQLDIIDNILIPKIAKIVRSI